MQKILDTLGIITAGLCGIHCIIMPVVFLLLPTVSHIHHHSHELNIFSFDILCLILAPLWALYPLIRGYKTHQNIYPVLFFILGFLCLCFGVFALHDNIIIHTLAMICGALGILTGHLVNIQFIKA